MCGREALQGEAQAYSAVTCKQVSHRPAILRVRLILQVLVPGSMSFILEADNCEIVLNYSTFGDVAESQH